MEGGWPDGLDRRGGQGPGAGWRRRWASAWATRRPAAGVGALGRQVLHARDDGHRPQPGPQRPVGRGPGQADQRRALRLRLLPPLRGHVRADRARHRRRRVRRACSTRPRSWPGPPPTPGSPSSCSATWSTPTSRSSSATPARRSPRTPTTSCAAPSKRSSPRGTVPGPSPTGPGADRPRPGHGGQRAGHGVRQPRRQVGHRASASPATRPPGPRASTATS